jgi:cytochrome P450
MTTLTCRRYPDVFDAGLPSIAYEHVDDPEEAHRLIAQARRQAPIAIGPHGPEILSYRLVRSVLRDDRFAPPKGLFLASQGITSGPLWERAISNLLSLDGAEHHRLRRLVAKAFTPRAAERLRGICAEVVTELTDGCAAAGHCDVVADIARRYPIPIICALLGVPARDWDLISAWADDIFKMFSWNVGGNEDVIEQAWCELDDYVDAMVAGRLFGLGDDLLSDLIRAEVDGDRLTHAELLMLAGGVLLAGTDTTRNQLAAAVQVLSKHPVEWQQLAEHPELAPVFVEELMRHTPIALSAIRMAREDVELGGVTIPAQTLVIANTAAANRDPEVYPDPERFDVTRAGPPAMLTFGGGVHYCLGSHLARLELTEALAVLTRRLHNVHLDGPVRWKPLTGITGPAALPVTFDAA